MDLKKEYAVQIGQWTDEWLKKDTNKAKLMSWDGSQGPIESTLTEEDTQSLGCVNDELKPLITSALKHRRTILAAGKDHSPLAKPIDLMTACRNNQVQNWLGKFASVNTCDCSSN